ncbi:putative clathrin assembly protein At5g57200 isoform X2 [Magnolia sinica]|uniref:putative clathrin assembly protein At5g57200 isoform X2 n=1 Tax=Magnolia sinica TaxID=86752 RepID=UPI00265B00FA|nr:putative clathrin assembly protein At5g57200 isoform X2 [Magnolia sinica]
MNKGPPVLSMEESCAKEIQEPPQLNIEPALQPPVPAADTGDLLGLNEINPDTAVIEESNAMALAIVPPVNGEGSLHQNRTSIGFDELVNSTQTAEIPILLIFPFFQRLDLV